MATLEDPIEIGDLTIPNRLYRAPLLGCAGNGRCCRALIDDLEPAAASGVGLICQGATIVRGEGGCAAPGMTRVHDAEFVEGLSRLTDRIHDHGSRIFIQLEHGGLRSMETWRRVSPEHPDLEQLAVSEPPWQLRLLDQLGFLEYDPHVLDCGRVRPRGGFRPRGRSSRRRRLRRDSPRRREHGDRPAVLLALLQPTGRRVRRLAEARLEFSHAFTTRSANERGHPLMTKVPAETPAPPSPLVRRKLSLADGSKSPADSSGSAMTRSSRSRHRSSGT